MGKLIAFVIGGLALLACFSIFLVYLFGATSIATSDFRGEVDKRERVEADGGYRIAAYDEFFSLCSAIQSQNDAIKNQEVLLDSTSSDEEREKLLSGIIALQNSKAELVNDYNAKSASDYTRGQFKDSDLPYRIDVGEENVSCS